ncbi:hypothetical protein [Flavobacterium kingsejongi]|uniref:hypothetical protein n=1 Tax=Flavobacterium kingsejongi TaxID=1678728 RepID=UPI0013002FA4|nr:hypothetical protein [Flavobacterium kingsejongi]
MDYILIIFLTNYGFLGGLIGTISSSPVPPGLLGLPMVLSNVVIESLAIKTPGFLGGLIGTISSSPVPPGLLGLPMVSSNGDKESLDIKTPVCSTGFCKVEKVSSSVEQDTKVVHKAIAIVGTNMKFFISLNF